MKFSIGMKIGGGFALVVFMLLIIGINSYFSLNRLIDAINWQKHTHEVIIEVDSVLSLLKDMETGQRGFIITGENQYLEPYNNAQNEIDSKIKNIMQLTVDNQAQQLRIAQLITKKTKKVKELNETIKSRKERGFAGALQLILTGSGKEVMDEMRILIGEIKTEENSLLQQRTIQLNESTNNAKNLIIWGILFAVVLISIVGFIISYRISTRLRSISAAAARITSRNDMNTMIPEDDRKDEVGTLSQAIRLMLENLRSSTADISESKRFNEELTASSDQLEKRTAELTHTLQKVKEAVNVIASSSSEILSATTQVASGTAETASAISETTTTVEEVRQAAQLSSEKAKNVSDKAQRVDQNSQEGRKAVAETSVIMEQIREQMHSIAQTIVSLSEQTQSIGGIIASVTDIADQSNLLAVNAAIEASKAGEHGKGFIVVAQEIKALAEQSKQATEQVRGILGDVQKSTGAAVMSTEQGSKAVDTGVKQAAKAGEAVLLLTESTREAAQMSIQIVASSQQQVVGMDQIGIAMKNINQAGAETALSMKQAETAAQNLHELGQKLKEIVDNSTEKDGIHDGS